MRYLIDTNILVQTLDSRDASKQQRAMDVIQYLQEKSQTALSTQTLSEYANVALRKFAVPAEKVHQHIITYEANFVILPVTTLVILEALGGMKNHHFSYFDAQIWAVAKLHRLAIILSEDFNVGATIEGVEFVNPLMNSFDINSL